MLKRAVSRLLVVAALVAAVGAVASPPASADEWCVGVWVEPIFDVEECVG